MRKFLFTVLAALLVTAALAPAPAAAVDFSAFGSWVDLQGADDSFGFGARVGFFDFFDHLQIQATVSWWDSFDQRIFGSGLVNTYNNTIDVVPIDLSGTWYFDGDTDSGLYAGAGVTYYNLSTDIGKFDDQLALYLQLGYQFNDLGLFIEGIYREADGELSDLPFPDEITTDFDVDLASFGINAGWRF